MKKIELHRSVKEGAEGAAVVVSDLVARKLLECPAIGAPPTASLVEDLGEDPPDLPCRVRITRPCSAGGGPVQVGDVIGVSERDARLLTALGKAEVISGHVEPAATEDVGAILSDAARDRGPLVRPLGRRESVK